MFEIALTNLGEYNKGRLVYQWLELPATQEQIEACLKGIGYPKEYFISAYETAIEGLKIEEHANIDTLNKVAHCLSSMDNYQLATIEACIAYHGSDYLKTAIENIDEIQFYEEIDLEELAEHFIDEGLFGDVSDALRPYIDTKRLGHALSSDGYYETPYGVIYTR